MAIATPVVPQMPGMRQGTQQQMKQQMGQMRGGQMNAAHTAMPQMADHMSAMTTQMKGHMAAVSKDMGKTLQAMERMQKRMGAAPARQPVETVV